MASTAAGRVAKLASFIIITEIFIASLPMCFNLAGVEASYDGTLLDSRCSSVQDERNSMRREITSTTNTLISGAKPGPPSAYVCAVPDQKDKKPDVWAWATCAERLTPNPKDCTDCLTYARDWLMNTGCPDRAGAHMFLQDCSIEYDNYEICHPY